MSSKLDKAKNALDELHYKLSAAVKELKEVEYSVGVSELSEEERMLYREYRKLNDLLGDSLYVLDYLGKPVRVEGTLYKNTDGRYEIDGEHELSSGSTVEVLLYDDLYDCDMWVKTRIEHTDGRYYLVGHKDVPMHGMRVRIR